MKNRIICAVFSLLIVVSALSGCGSSIKVKVPDVAELLPPSTTENDINSTNYTTVAENDTFVLSINKDTTHFKVVNKADGKTYSSLPAETLEGSVGSNSLFQIEYLNSLGNMASMSSYEDCVKKGQYKIDTIENGVKITFSLGNINEELYCPTSFTVERFEEITGQIKSTFDKTHFKSMYYKANIDNIPDKSERSALLEKYPKLADQELYVLKNDSLSLSLQRKINTILVSIGYNDDDYAKDMEGSKGLENAENPAFNIPLYLTLNDSGLDAKIPVPEISEYYNGTLISIDLFKFFNTPSPGTNGYFLLPDASGSIMNFYNGKNDKQQYSVAIYGRDRSIKGDEQIYHQDDAYLPVFANVANDGALFCRISDGESLASIIARPGDSTTHAHAFVNFKVREITKNSLSSASKEQGDYFYVTQKQLYDGDIALSMTFFDSQHNKIKNFADYYRQILFGNDNTASEQPLMLEFVGVDRINSSVMGVSTKIEKVYTTLPQVLSMLKELKDGGVKSMSVTLDGFFDHGLSQSFAANLKLNKNVGDSADLKELTEWAAENDVSLYFNVDVQYVYDDNELNFKSSKNSTYMITKETGKDYNYNPITFQLDTSDTFRYILNPTAITKSVDHVLELSDELKTGFSLTYVGSDVNSDFRESSAIERQNALKSLIENVKRVSDNTDVATKGANASVLPYVTSVSDISMRAMQFDICDQAVPFLQMVLQGNVTYCDVARNISGNTDVSLLDTMRTGGSLHYILTADESLVFTKTGNNKLTSTKFSFWKDRILSEYAKASAVSEHTSTGIVDSYLVQNQMYRTVYADGSSMVVNYSNAAQTYNGIEIASFDYIITEGAN